MLKHGLREGSNNCYKKENNKVIKWYLQSGGNVHFGDIKEALPKSSNDEEGFRKYN